MIDSNDILERTRMLLGEESMKKISRANVAVFGIGGVGGYACEALCRAGTGTLHLIDRDKVAASNINRQIIANTKTVGLFKTDLMKSRILEINPEIKVYTYNMFFDNETKDFMDFSSLDYIVDAIDTVTSKILLAKLGDKYGIPVISCMGAGNKTDPGAFEVSDIYKTSVCPLARVMRRELKKAGIRKLKVVYSKEMPFKTGVKDPVTGKAVPASISFVPPVAGLIAAGEVIRDIAGIT